jgi:hypothetical protein
MEQHPVPQNISSYQFHLVGDMTLKQFLELAAGVVVGVIIYATGLPGLIKWPLILFSAGMGAALAFVPLEERPLEQWIVAFFRSVYSPTLFHWEKNANVKYFQDENGAMPTSTGVARNARTTDTNATAPALDTAEKSYLSRLTQIFNPSSAAPLTQTTQNATQGVINHAPTVPATEIKKDINIPQTTYISVDKSQRPQMTIEETDIARNAPTTISTQPVAEVMVGQTTGTINQTPTKAAAIFSLDAAPPSLPTIVNTISGQVMTSQNKIIEGAVLEILDAEGRSVRALRTNRAGHFLNVTPLMDGKYKIVIEKEGYNFEPIEFEAQNTIIQPIAIHAK